jgi:hypothetical protein
MIEKKRFLREIGGNTDGINTLNVSKDELLDCRKRGEYRGVAETTTIEERYDR